MIKTSYSRIAYVLTGIAIGFVCSFLLSNSTLRAQTEDLSDSPAYGLVTAEFFSGNRVAVMQEFSRDVDTQMKNGWKCLGAPVIEKTGNDLQPIIIVQTMIKE